MRVKIISTISFTNSDFLHLFLVVHVDNLLNIVHRFLKSLLLIFDIIMKEIMSFDHCSAFFVIQKITFKLYSFGIK